MAERVGFEPTGTVTRTTVFEFYDSHVGRCRPVPKRVRWFGISHAIIPACGAPCHAVLSGSFANPFANSLDQPMSAFEVKSDIPDPHAHVR